MKNPLVWLIGLGLLSVLGVSAALYLLQQDLSCPTVSAANEGLNHDIQNSLKLADISTSSWLAISSNTASSISVFRTSKNENARVQLEIARKPWLGSGGAARYCLIKGRTVYVCIADNNLVAVMLREENHAPSAYTVMKIDCFLKNSGKKMLKERNEQASTTGPCCTVATSWSPQLLHQKVVAKRRSQSLNFYEQWINNQEQGSKRGD